jgi:hypothetical protein
MDSLEAQPSLLITQKYHFWLFLLLFWKYEAIIAFACRHQMCLFMRLRIEREMCNQNSLDSKQGNWFLYEKN